MKTWGLGLSFDSLQSCDTDIEKSFDLARIGSSMVPHSVTTLYPEIAHNSKVESIVSVFWRDGQS